MKRIAVLIALCWCFAASAAAPDTLYISTSQTVHVRFASELKYVNLGSRDIVARIVDGAKDFVAVKARAPFEGVTSMSCLEVNGEMHTFWVAFAERPSQLEVDTRLLAGGGHMGTGSGGQMGTGDSPALDSLSFSSSSALAEVAAMPQELYHLGVSGYGIQVLCENLFYRDDVLYLVVSLRNDSAVSYELSTPRFAVESARRSRRGLQYEKGVFPKASYGLGVVAPGACGRMVFTFEKIALVKGQVFRVYLYEKGGSRNFVLTLGPGDINGARRM